ncbi:hypothetical protein SHKM778_50000 [Streptomyces sp. KM77-8]|uniref:Uncharacterized protein n=1 Tax=Streptomyces haneummycinicus TaxID=3074435 RepID=A0AAT9HMG4_9ACTN
MWKAEFDAGEGFHGARATAVPPPDTAQFDGETGVAAGAAAGRSSAFCRLPLRSLMFRPLAPLSC